MRSKSQIFSDAVFPNVEQMARLQQDGEDQRARKYKALCKRAGSLVRNSGLVQALAFFQARGQRVTEVHYMDLYNHLEAEMRGLRITPGNSGLIDYVKAAELPKYMYCTREALHLLNWHKRLSDILIEGSADHEEGDES